MRESSLKSSFYGLDHVFCLNILRKCQKFQYSKNKHRSPFLENVHFLRSDIFLDIKKLIFKRGAKCIRGTSKKCPTVLIWTQWKQ